jgi:hypothetical protein
VPISWITWGSRLVASSGIGCGSSDIEKSGLFFILISSNVLGLSLGPDCCPAALYGRLLLRYSSHDARATAITATATATPIPALAPVDKPVLCCDTAMLVCGGIGVADVEEDDTDGVMVDVEDVLVVGVVVVRSEAWKLSCIKGAQREYVVIVVVIAVVASAGVAVIVAGKVK